MERCQLKKQNKQSKSSKEKVLTPNQLCKLVKSWQETLSMCDWAASAAYAAPKEMMKEHVIGMCMPDQEHKQFKVVMLHPKHYEGAGYVYTLRDFEHTLVHEILHAQLDCLDIPQTRTRELEQVINLTAEALLYLKYSGK